MDNLSISSLSMQLSIDYGERTDHIVESDEDLLMDGIENSRRSVSATKLI